MIDESHIKGLRLDLEPLEPLEHLSTHIQKRYFDQMEQLIDWEIIKSKAVVIRMGVKIVMQQFQHFFSKSEKDSANRDFTTSPPLSKRNPSKKLDKDGIDYIPVCGDCCHWLSQRNYCLKRKWDAYANSEGCESFAYTDEDTQGSMIEKGGAEE